LAADLHEGEVLPAAENDRQGSQEADLGDGAHIRVWSACGGGGIWADGSDSQAQEGTTGYVEDEFQGWLEVLMNQLNDEE
jgi:hypothetical protein